MTKRASDHGPRLTDAEFSRRVAALQDHLPAAPDKQQRRALARAEFDLTVDHRLGRDFPSERREALWAVHRKTRSRPVWFMLKHFVRRLLGMDRARVGRRLAGAVVRAYGQVLTPAELEQFFGEAETREPALPVDSD